MCGFECSICNNIQRIECRFYGYGDWGVCEYDLIICKNCLLTVQWSTSKHSQYPMREQKIIITILLFILHPKKMQIFQNCSKRDHF